MKNSLETTKQAGFLSSRHDEHSDTIDNFVLIIGAMKSGTTALFSLLEQHPQICSSQKEPTFFVSYNFSPDKLNDYFDNWDYNPGIHKYALDASTSYTKFPTHGNSAKMINQAGINAKFIYIMRHPMQRIYSHLRMAQHTGYPLFNKHNMFIPEMYSLYYKQISEYYKHFPAEEIMLLNFDNFVANPEKMLKQICSFLQINSDFRFDILKMNRHRSRSNLEQDNLLLKIIRKVFFPELVSLYRSNKKIRSLLSNKEINNMKTNIREDMKRLQADFGFDTRNWTI